MNLDEELADLLTLLASRNLIEAAAPIEEAFRLAASAHGNQQRDDGSPYVLHPLRVARRLIDPWGVRESDLIIAALLHDTVEDTDLTLGAIEEHFGPRVSELVDHLSKPPREEGVESDQRTARYFERLEAGPPGAVLVKASDRLANLEDVLGARWPEAKKRRYLEETRQLLIPIVAKHHPERSGELTALCAELEAALDRGEGDVPDVGPHEDLEGAAGVEDPVFEVSRHLSFFRRGPDIYLYHDLIGDIIQMHEVVLGFLDYFRVPHRESEARTAFASEFLPGDLDAFFETLGEHLVLVPEGRSDEVVVAEWRPLRGPWIISHRSPKGTVTLCYKDRRAGEIVSETLPPLLGGLFELCDGELTTGEIVKRLARRFPAEEDLEGKVRRSIRLWTHSQRQLLKLIPRPKEAYDLAGGLPPYAASTMPYDLMRRSDEPPPEPIYETRDYHKLEIDSADEQFDLKETTISHALRVPHPALGGRTYGGALAKVLVERDLLPSAPTQTFRAAEVGGGTGFFARAFLDGLALHAPRLYNRLRYVIVELSPELRRSQAERTRTHGGKVRVVGGDAERLPLADASVDFLVANEMIADLRVSPVRRQDLEPGGEGGGPGAELVQRFQLPCDDAPGLFFVNLGAILLLEEVARVLKPGGTALLTEYGSHTRYPEASTHLDHAEYSIHFGHMKAAASKLGLEASIEGLGPLLGLDGSVPVLQTTQSFFETLRAFLASRGVAVGKIAYTEEMFDELLGTTMKREQLLGLDFAPCGNRLLGLKPGEFQALTLRKPMQAGRQVKAIRLDI